MINSVLQALISVKKLTKLSGKDGEMAMERLSLILTGKRGLFFDLNAEGDDFEVFAKQIMHLIKNECKIAGNQNPGVALMAVSHILELAMSNVKEEQLGLECIGVIVKHVIDEMEGDKK